MSEKALSWTYTEEIADQDDVIAKARALGEELGAPAVSRASGAMLRTLAGAMGARTVLEIGTGTGTSALYLLEGMAASGVITSIDIESEFHKAARGLFPRRRYPLSAHSPNHRTGTGSASPNGAQRLRHGGN